jgi:hypothetical protein
MIFRPLPATRVANAAPGLALAVLGIAAISEATAAPQRFLGGALLAVSAIVAVRGYRMAVEVHENSVVVRGLLRTRTVPRAAIRSVTLYPAVRWQNRRGAARWTPLTMFISWTPMAPRYAEHHDDCAQALARTLHVPYR